MGLLDAPPSLSMYWGHTGWMSCLRCHKKYTKREQLTQCLQHQKMRPNPERRSQKVLIIPENKSRPHLFPSHLSLPLAAVQFPDGCWCPRRFCDALHVPKQNSGINIFLIYWFWHCTYVQYWSTTRQIVFVSSNFDWTLIYQNVVAFCQSQTH